MDRRNCFGLTSHGVSPEWINRLGCEAFAQKIDRRRPTAADIARPENSSRSAYFFQWQLAARADERSVSSHRLSSTLRMTNDQRRRNEEIRSQREASLRFVIRASALF
jgi:hypothetical protein